MSIISRFLPGSTAASKQRTAAVLRSDLAHDPLYDAAQTLTAFSPDIIPLNEGVDRRDIAQSFNSFVAHPLHCGETNNVWLRAKSFGLSSAAASLHEIPNELVLWPQTWAGAPSVGEVTLSRVEGTNGDILVSDAAVVVPKKTHEPGTHSTLLALTRKGTQRVSASPRNWRHLVEVLGADETLVVYNVLAVEPALEYHQLKTRLRVFEDEHEWVQMRLSLEAIGVPKVGIEARLDVLAQDGAVMFSLDRVSLSSFGAAPGVDVRLPAGFDGSVKVEVFKAPDVNVCDLASISIVCTALRSDGTNALLGAEHILFDSAVTFKQYFDMRSKQWSTSNFYFRAFMGDGAPPRRRQYAFSPDVQPAGQTPDSEPGKTYGNFNVDVANQRGNKLVPNTSNFIYGRLTAQRAVSGTARVFAVPNTMLLYPNKFHKFSVWDVVHDKATGQLREDVGYRGFSSNAAGQIVIPSPWDLYRPAEPGAVAAGSNHFCLVIEGIEGVDPANPNAYTHWPHQDVLAATSTFAAWLLNEPRVAYRNTTYDSTANAGVISYRTDLSPPNMATASDTWYYELELENVPVGSQVEVIARVISANAPAKLPANLGITRKTVEDSNQSFPSARFTGVDQDFHLLLTINWYPNGRKPNPDQQLNANAVLRANKLGLMSQTLKPHWKPTVAETELVVFPDYPLFKQNLRTTMRTSRSGGYTGLRGAMRAYDAPGSISTSAVPEAEGMNIIEVVLGSDSLRVVAA